MVTVLFIALDPYINSNPRTLTDDSSSGTYFFSVIYLDSLVDIVTVGTVDHNTGCGIAANDSNMVS